MCFQLAILLLSIREFNIANEEWEAEDNTKDILPESAIFDLFAVDGEMFALSMTHKTYRYTEGGTPSAWEQLTDTKVTHDFAQNFVYKMSYHQLL